MAPMPSGVEHNLEKESSFRQWYDKGVKKEEYWIPTLDDALTILAISHQTALVNAADRVYRLEKGQVQLITG